MLLREIPEVQADCLIPLVLQLQPDEVLHGFDFVHSVFHGRIAHVIENCLEHRRRWIENAGHSYSSDHVWSTSTPIASEYSNCSSAQGNLATGCALLGLIIGRGKRDLIHASSEFYAVDDSVVSPTLRLIRSLLSVRYCRLKCVLVKIDGYADCRYLSAFF